MKKLLFLSAIFTSIALVAANQPRNLLNYRTAEDAIEAGWKGNYGSELQAEMGNVLKALGATHHGGLGWRPNNLDLTGAEKLCFKIRQNIHPKYPINIQIQIKYGIGKISYINKLTPSGAGWRKWQKVTIDLSKEKLGKVSSIGLYSEAFKNTKTKFIKLTDFYFVRKPLENPAKKLKPVYTFPFMKKSPDIDGKIDTAEWSLSGGTSGFVGLSGKFSPRQTQVRYGYDDKFLYVAFTSPFESAGNHARGKSGILKKSDLNNGLDFFELWLKTPGKHIQFMFNMNTGIFQYDHNKNKLIKSGIIYKTTFKVNNYLNGGTWYGEIAVPLSVLGKSPEQLKVLFGRDFPPKGGQRSQMDWTSSSPITVGFKNQKCYANAILSKSLPAICVEKFGNLQEAQINVSGSAFDPALKKVQFSLNVFSKQDGYLMKLKQNLSNKQELQNFTLGQNLKLNKETKAFFTLQATDLTSKKIVYAQKFKFTCGSPLRIKCVPLAKSGKLIIKVDTRSVKGLSRGGSMLVQILDGKQEKQTKSFKLPSGKMINTFTMDCAALDTQWYKVKCIIKKGKKAVAKAIIPKVWLGKPEWLNNIGITDEIPPPWTPIKLDGQKVSTIGREYILLNSGLPRVVKAINKNILATPAVLKAQVNNMSETIKFKALKLLKKKPNQVKWALKGSSRSLKITGTLTIDYDGFALWSIKVKPRYAGVLNKFYISFALPFERAMYARGNMIGGPAGGYSANLGGTGKAKTVKIAWSEHSYNGWAWPENFFYKFFVGDDDSGLSIMSETSEFHSGNKHISVVNSGDKRLVNIMLTSQQRLIPGKELKYEYAWVGLPLSPRPKNPKLWHQAIGATGYRDKPLTKIDPEFFKEIPSLVGSRYMRYDSHYQLSNPDPAKRVKRRHRMDSTNFVTGMNRAAKYGCKVITDAIYFSAMDTSTPSVKKYKDSWKITPGGYSWYNYHGALDLAACPQSSWQDFLVYTCAKILDDTPLNGVYLDVSAETPCNNAFHGCGYTDEKGRRHSTVNLWSMRELHKRVYTYYNTGGRKGIMIHHHLDTAAWAGFCNGGFQGEEWAASKSYKVMTPEYFRAMTMNQYGPPYTFFSIFSYYQVTPIGEIMAICLPNYTLPAIWGYRKGNWPAVKPYWNIMDSWWTTSEFVGYWDENPPSNVKDKRILVSAYVKKDSTLLVVANWKWKTENVTLDVDSKVIGFVPSKAYDLLNKKPLQIKNGQIKMSIPKRDVLLIRLEK